MQEYVTMILRMQKAQTLIKNKDSNLPKETQIPKIKAIGLLDPVSLESEQLISNEVGEIRFKDRCPLSEAS